MSNRQYDPDIHHRRSIRLKEHDYSGGGLYFVTLCAHRNAGNIFTPPDVKKMVGHVWESATAVGAPLMGAPNPKPPAPLSRIGALPPYIVMPDHFHALIRIEKDSISLGEVIGAFKSRVVHEYIAGVKAGKWPRFHEKIWQRNYYERIVRDAGAEIKIADYIRMNPWKCISHFGDGLRGIGNPNLLNSPTLGILCSRTIPSDCNLEPPEADGAFISGFHSPPEKEILETLLRRNAKLICCPAWGIDTMRIPEIWLPALEQNRMLILETGAPIKDAPTGLAAAEHRNQFILRTADRTWIPHATPGGMIDRLVREVKPTPI